MSVTVSQGVDIREVADVPDLQGVEALLAGIWRTQADRPPVSAEIRPCSRSCSSSIAMPCFTEVYSTG